MMRKLALSAFALLFVAGTAAADPIELPEGEPLIIKFNNLEQVDPTLENSIDVPDSTTTVYGEAGNWGVFIVETIAVGTITTGDETGGTNIGAGDPPFFVNGQDGGNQIYGIFYDIDLTSGTSATGGFIELYWSDTLTVSLATATPDSATVTDFTSGTLLARIEFASGIDPSDPTTFITSSTDLTTLPGSGFADSYGNVVTGTTGVWESVLNGDWFITDFGRRDISFSNFFQTSPDWDAPCLDVEGAQIEQCLGFESFDPATVFTQQQVVPEPATLTLLGIGLTGLAARRRRSKKAKAA